MARKPQGAERIGDPPANIDASGPIYETPVLAPSLPATIREVAAAVDRHAHEIGRLLEAAEVLFGRPAIEAFSDPYDELRYAGHRFRTAASAMAMSHISERTAIEHKLSNQRFRTNTLRGILAAAVDDTASRFRRASKPLPAWVDEARRFLEHIELLEDAE